jgi:hypothetical protein
MTSTTVRKIFYLIIFCTGCKEQDSLDKPITVNFREFYSRQYMQIDTFVFTTNINGNEKSYYYSNSNNSFHYIINTENLSCKLYNDKDTTVLRYCKQDSYYYDDKEYFIYKYSSGSELNDGELYHYLSKEYGLISINSVHWKSGKCFANSMNKEHEMILLNHLNRILINRTFLFDCK